MDEILSAAAAEAAPVAQQLLQLRQQMLNASRKNSAEELKAAQDGYAAAAAKIGAIEAAAFGKVYAMLKPNQQKDSAEAFTLLAGLFSVFGQERRDFRPLSIRETDSTRVSSRS